ncbi:receptor-like protein kinase HSL1-like [Trifolium medium]|uniref:Receptor-like protein kinase HSL1-like n=1 Tax=Trifolium medium TaxID=97028 RepID=A0A392NYJ5_9FABA|nr:receptor-like protein kinase HSL1-like [Trifolium medium]
MGVLRCTRAHWNQAYKYPNPPNFLHFTKFFSGYSQILSLGSLSPLHHSSRTPLVFITSRTIPDSGGPCGGTLRWCYLFKNGGGVIVILLCCLSLMRVRLGYNNLSGVVPYDIWGLPHVYPLELVENSLFGSVSNAISHTNNQCSTAMVKLSQLGRLVLGDNQFSGEIPHGIGDWEKLNELDLANNMFYW